MKKLLYFLSLALMTLLLSSCATAPRPPAQRAYIPAPPQVTSMAAGNIVHVVAAGDTLYRLSKVYSVPMREIMRANDLTDASVLEKGQQLIIPPAASIKTSIPLFRTNKWRYIIVHHSATDTGDARFINLLHRRKGWNEIGYDFVIDNGTKAKADGAIEISPRWTKQEEGAHCRASDMNNKGIGICLIGNFSETRVSRKQMASLIYLVNVLQKYYAIPDNHIMGHGQVPGARTECPGKYFPWADFRNKLENS